MSVLAAVKRAEVRPALSLAVLLTKSPGAHLTASAAGKIGFVVSEATPRRSRQSAMKSFYASLSGGNLNMMVAREVSVMARNIDRQLSNWKGRVRTREHASGVGGRRLEAARSPARPIGLHHWSRF